MLWYHLSSPQTIDIHRTPTDGVQQAPHRRGQQTSHKAAKMKQERSCTAARMEEEEEIARSRRQLAGEAASRQTTALPPALGQFPSVCAGAVQRVAHLGGQSARHQAAQGLSGTWRWCFRRWWSGGGGGGESRSAVPRWRCLRLRRRHRRHLFRVLTLNRRMLRVVCLYWCSPQLFVSPRLLFQREPGSLRLLIWCAVLNKYCQAC